MAGSRVHAHNHHVTAAHAHDEPVLPPRTPGTLGVSDAADPNRWSTAGDTPGALGIHDHASPDRAGSRLHKTVAAMPSAAQRRGAARGEVLKAALPFLQSVEGFPPHPYWPGGESGITIGYGYDLRHHDAAQIRRDWSSVGIVALEQLVAASGRIGSRQLASDLAHIAVPAADALRALEAELPAFYDQTLQVFPGLAKLPLEAQVALMSLVFNRGTATTARLGTDRWSAGGVDRRREMRFLQRDVANGDLIAIWQDLRSMARVWFDTALEQGMKTRREREAALIWPLIADEYQASRETLFELGSPVQ